MVPVTPQSSSRVTRRRMSFLLASALSRVGMAAVCVLVIWAATGWAMGWW